MPRVKKIKKKSNYTIGHEHEAEYEDILKMQGWITHLTPKPKRWEENKDMFNLFDILAFKDGTTRLTQVKTSKDDGSIKRVQDWAIAYNTDLPDNIILEVVIKRYASKRKPARWQINRISKHIGIPITKTTIGGKEKCPA